MRQRHPALRGLHAVLLVTALALLPASRLASADPDTSSGHDIRLPASDQADVGETRALSLTIAARPGHTISRDGPLSIDLTTPDVEPDADPAARPPIIELPRRRYQRRDAADVQADAPRFDLRYTARAPGQTTLRVSLFFWVCSARLCWPVSESRDVRIDVRAPGARNDTGAHRDRASL